MSAGNKPTNGWYKPETELPPIRAKPDGLPMVKEGRTWYKHKTYQNEEEMRRRPDKSEWAEMYERSRVFYMKHRQPVVCGVLDQHLRLSRPVAGFADFNGLKLKKLRPYVNGKSVRGMRAYRSFQSSGPRAHPGLDLTLRITKDAYPYYAFVNREDMRIQFLRNSRFAISAATSKSNRFIPVHIDHPMDYYKLDAKTKKPVYRLVTKKNYQKYIQDFQETSQSASQELSFEAKRQADEDQAFTLNACEQGRLMGDLEKPLKEKKTYKFVRIERDDNQMDHYKTKVTDPPLVRDDERLTQLTSDELYRAPKKETAEETWTSIAVNDFFQTPGTQQNDTQYGMKIPLDQLFQTQGTQQNDATNRNNLKGTASKMDTTRSSLDTSEHLITPYQEASTSRKSRFSEDDNSMNFAGFRDAKTARSVNLFPLNTPNNQHQFNTPEGGFVMPSNSSVKPKISRYGSDFRDNSQFR